MMSSGNSYEAQGNSYKVQGNNQHCTHTNILKDERAQVESGIARVGIKSSR